jgi:hypothetical protein
VLDKWLESMLKLYAPQIAWLHQQRDAKIAQWQKQTPGENAFDCEDLEELSSLPIDLVKQINWLQN